MRTHRNSNTEIPEQSYFENSSSQCFQWFDNVRNFLISCGFSGFLGYTYVSKQKLPYKVYKTQVNRFIFK